MADNTVLPSGSGGDTIRTIDRTTFKTQVINLDFGGEAGPESLVTTANPLPVNAKQSGTWSGVGVTGTFWQATQPVSGTFWQTTQPVSIATMPSTPVTGTFWQTTQPISGTVTANISGSISNTSFTATQATGTNLHTVVDSGSITVANASIPVTGTFYQATQPVSGTFWQTTQPVSIATMPTTPVTGTFYQATQPVSIASMPSTPVTGTFWQATQPVSLASTTITGTVAVTQATITKGTQGATGVTTQDLKDSGRNARIFMLDAYTAAPVAEALQTVVQWYSNAAVAGTTTPAVVPAGKTLRLTSIQLYTKSLATLGSAVLRIRANTAGVAVIGSPLVYSVEAGSIAGAATVAVTGALGLITVELPDGFEFPAGTGLGFTLAGYGPTGTLTLEGVTRFVVSGFEY